MRSVHLFVQYVGVERVISQQFQEEDEDEDEDEEEEDEEDEDEDEDEDEWCQFPHLQPRAELRRNQRGEIGRQHIKGASGSRFSPL